ISTAQQSKLAHEFFAANRISEFKMVTTELSAHDAGAVVYQTGFYSEIVQPNDSTAPASTYRQNFLARWTRGADGTWRFQRFLATPRPDVGEVLPVPALPDEPAGSIDAGVATTQITARMNDYGAALRANQPAAVVAFWKDDGQFYEPDVQLAGKTALAQLVQGALNSMRIVDYQYQTDQMYVHDRGAIAYQFGNFTETFEPRDGQRPAVTVRNNFVARWRRGASGSWSIDRFFATPAPAQPMAAQ
ncbi:MAG: YybH family protein, partial [Longimicrobiales bacterium]